MRLFIAAELPEDVEDALLENMAELRELISGKAVRPDSLHLTLAFIGEVEPARADAAAACMRRACIGHRAIDIRLDDYGSFGHKEKATLWQGIEVESSCSDSYGSRGYNDGREGRSNRNGGSGSYSNGGSGSCSSGNRNGGVENALVALANDVREELKLAGFDIDAKPFKPHITLMRNADLSSATLPMPFSDEGAITRITLFQSTLGGPRAIYDPLETVELPGDYTAASDYAAADGYASADARAARQGVTLLIDADACPVTSEALAAARRANVAVVIAGNATQNLMKHVRRNDPTEPRDGFWVDTLVAPSGADAADFAIVEQLKPFDIVVTQDIGLAAMALGRGAFAIGVRGRPYTKEGIDAQLLVRHEEKRVRRQGGRTQGPAAFTAEDRQHFAHNLEKMLAEAKAAHRS